VKRMTLLLLLFFICSNRAFSSESFVPYSSEFVVAKWPVQTLGLNVSNQIQNLLNDASYPGNSANYSIAASLLKQSSTQDLSVLDRLYYGAVIKQHYHRFKESKELLLTLLKTQAKNPNALLLLSNMYSVLGEHQLAEKMCIRLISIAPQTFVATCVLNVRAQEGDLKSSLEQLATFLKNNDLSAQSNEGLGIWSAETLASLARANGELKRAQRILAPYIDKKVPVSFWVLWSDIELELEDPERVMNRLQSIVKSSQNQDDALILRLALAEQRLVPLKSVWLEKVRARIDLRESRNDTEHAFDIALYYYFIERKYHKAHSWALINWDKAKLLDDKNLLKMTQDALQMLPADKQFMGDDK
jgi:tetratricopeptide (TPR) repeat protein